MSFMGNDIAPNGRSVRSRGGSRDCSLLLPSASPIETREGKVSHGVRQPTSYWSGVPLPIFAPNGRSVRSRGDSVKRASAIAQCQPDRNQRRQGITHGVRQPTSSWSDVPLPTIAPNGRSVRSRGDSKKQSFCYCPVPARSKPEKARYRTHSATAY